MANIIEKMTGYVWGKGLQLVQNKKGDMVMDNNEEKEKIREVVGKYSDFLKKGMRM